MNPPVVRSRWYRIVMSPRTLYLFRRYFKMAGEEHPTLMALRYTWKTL